jgi:hypothetical protein
MEMAMKLSEIAREMAKLASAPKSAPEPPKLVIPEIDPATRAARDRIKALTLGRPGAPFYADEMTPEELQQKCLQNRMAHVATPRNSWLDPRGERRSIWDREI